MPHRSRPHRREDANHYASGQPRAHGSGARARSADYTLLHRGRQLRLGPIAFWVVVGTLVIMGVWTITTATYFAFREDVLTRLIARQAEMQFAYEDRIAELRAQVDRISSRQLLDQEQYEQKLDQALKRQALLESRATALNALPDLTPTGSIKQPARTPPAEPSRSRAPKPAPINNDSLIFVPAPERDAQWQSPFSIFNRTAKAQPGVAGVLVKLQRSLDHVETQQTQMLNTIEQRYDTTAKRIRSVLAELAIDSIKLPPATPLRGTGGPFVPVQPGNDASAFERQLQRIQLVRSQVERLNRTLLGVPVRQPLMGDIDFSSSFGVRLDPFTRSPAMHTGVDLRADSGDPVRATANGTVTIASWQGGYGRMVEIDHGNGLSTRYGHLLSIAVTVGQKVAVGQVIGRVGSTGRSTGPHLHYETRHDGDPVDPRKFLRAGTKLGG
jgi:murein DD-endopeptidase MepM/ murein hydrolase activator NlpD